MANGFSVLADDTNDETVLRCVGHTEEMAMVNWLAFYCEITCTIRQSTAEIEAVFKANGKDVHARVVPVRVEIVHG